MAESPRPTSVALILDCSKTMAEPFSAGADTTRWEVATKILQDVLDDLADSGNSRVALYCLGHRLKWADDSDQPDFVEQEAYLEASLGFDALRSLVPGDDVERVLQLRPFSPQDIALLGPKLNALQPWGERPVHLAVLKALEELGSEPAVNNRRIVIITDGKNQQHLSQALITQEMVISSLEKCLVPIHVLYLGDDGGQDKFRPLAEFAGGNVKAITTTKRVSIAQLLESLSEPVQANNDGKERVTSTGAKESKESTPATHFVGGNIVMNGRPVSMAVVTLEGTNQSPTKTDRTGRFVFRDVPAGRYPIKVQAVVQNMTRKRAQEIVVFEDRATEVTIDIK